MSLADRPALQALHTVPSSSSWNSPGAQSLHSVCPRNGCTLPRVQAVQADDPSTGATRPGAQSSQEALPAVVRKLPLGQGRFCNGNSSAYLGSAAMASCISCAYVTFWTRSRIARASSEGLIGWKKPGLAGVHSVKPSAAWGRRAGAKVPTLHSEQPTALASDEVPPGQGKQSTLLGCLVVDRKRPAWHGEQTDAPWGLNVPGSQAWQVSPTTTSSSRQAMQSPVPPIHSSEARHASQRVRFAAVTTNVSAQLGGAHGWLQVRCRTTSSSRVVEPWGQISHFEAPGLSAKRPAGQTWHAPASAPSADENVPAGQSSQR
mmetsp:Transcript_15504/g.58770  ORF Transcript_15504/g.58770 Transcript_15504/m.58770 type:complete len:318 (-) Transcript_15504:6280-7233(-)